MRNAPRWLRIALLVLAVFVLAYAMGPGLRSRVWGRPPALKGGTEKDNRSIGELDLEKLYPALVLRTHKGSDKIVALTFDDGPDSVYTPQVLDVLAEKGVKATFFLIGNRIEADADVVRRIAEEGHAIGNHSYSHPALQGASPQVAQEIEKTKEVLGGLGLSDSGMFRPPYGAAEPSLIEQVAGMGYKVAMWSVDSLDWRGLSRAEVFRNIEGYVEPGSVILQHSAGGPGEDLSGSVLATGDVIDMLKAKGYRFVTLPQMFGDALCLSSGYVDEGSDAPK